MNIIDNIKSKAGEWKKNAEEKARFRKFVDEQTLPIRRKAYLEEKKRLAVQEGKKIADKSIKSNEPQKESQFIPTQDWSFDFKKEFNKKEVKKNGK